MSLWQGYIFKTAHGRVVVVVVAANDKSEPSVIMGRSSPDTGVFMGNICQHPPLEELCLIRGLLYHHSSEVWPCPWTNDDFSLSSSSCALPAAIDRTPRRGYLLLRGRIISQLLFAKKFSHANQRRKKQGILSLICDCEESSFVELCILPNSNAPKNRRHPKRLHYLQYCVRGVRYSCRFLRRMMRVVVLSVSHRARPLEPIPSTFSSICACTGRLPDKLIAFYPSKFEH